jgi:hypothetical protein
MSVLSELYIYPHQGLGDQIICNGMVRHFAKSWEKVFVFSKTEYYENVAYMYRDAKNIKVLHLKDDNEISSYIKSSGDISEDNLIVPGHSGQISSRYSHIEKYMYGENLPFDQAFYRMAGLDFEKRFSDFYFERDYSKEEEVFKELNPSGEKYIFVQDDPDRGFVIDNNKLPDNIKIIRNDKRYRVFDYLSILENAEEIHMMESSIQSLINSYYFDKPELYLHKYVRNYPYLMLPKERKAWTEIF